MKSQFVVVLKTSSRSTHATNTNMAATTRHREVTRKDENHNKSAVMWAENLIDTNWACITKYTENKTLMLPVDVVLSSHLHVPTTDFHVGVCFCRSLVCYPRERHRSRLSSQSRHTDPLYHPHETVVNQLNLWPCSPSLRHRHEKH